MLRVQHKTVRAEVIFDFESFLVQLAAEIPQGCLQKTLLRCLLLQQRHACDCAGK
jgi:hypothetical protein